MSKTSLDFLWILGFLWRQSKCEESALSRLHILADLLGNRSTFVIVIDIIFSIRFACLYVPCFWTLEFGRVILKNSKFYIYRSKFFHLLLYNEAWQVLIVPVELPNPEETQIWESEN